MGETMDATVTGTRGFPFLLRFSSRAWIHFATSSTFSICQKNSRQGLVSARARDATRQPIGQRPTASANTNRIGNAYILFLA